MALIQFNVDMSVCARALVRIADALDRAWPVPIARDRARPVRDDRIEEPQSFHVAESPEEYRARTDAEAQLAVSLGFAPWSPQFQSLISGMKRDLMRASYEKDEATGEIRESAGLSEAEAEQALRDAFQLAKAQANEITQSNAGSKTSP